MSKRKKIIIIASVVIVLLAVFIANVLIPEKEEEEVATPTPFLGKDYRDNFQIPTGETIRTSGQTVENFYTDDTTINSRGDAILVNTAGYRIIYFSEEDQFLISVLTSPFEEMRKAAEIDFLRTLNIDEDKACRINVVITTPNYANPDEAGINYKLSFCESE